MQQPKSAAELEKEQARFFAGFYRRPGTPFCLPKALALASAVYAASPLRKG